MILSLSNKYFDRENDVYVPRLSELSSESKFEILNFKNEILVILERMGMWRRYFERIVRSINLYESLNIIHNLYNPYTITHNVTG